MIVGIPVHNDLANFQEMLESLCFSTEALDNIVIIESGSNEKTLEYCSQLETLSMGSLKVIHTPKEGPLKAYNRLFEIAKEKKEDLFLTQTDVTFPKFYKRDWLKEMQELAKREDCGMISCRNGGGVSGPDFISGFQWVGAWCTYIPFRTIDKIGGYDENIPLGWGVDIDYTYAVNQLGLQIYVIDYFVNHHPNYEEGHQHEKVENIEQLKKEAFAYMRRKWNVVDR